MRFFKLIYLFYTAFLLVSISELSEAQVYFNGFGNRILGEEISYHAPDPRASEALLVRAQDSTRYVQWESAVIPESTGDETIHLVWMFGMDASSEQHYFKLSVDGKELVRFNNPALAQKGEKSFEGRYGTKLEFRTTKIDRHKDVMGYAVLTLPSNLVVKGRAVVLQVNGESAGSNIWYMTFQYPVEDEIKLRSQDLLIREKDQNKQAVLIEIVNLDREKTVQVWSGQHPKEKYILFPGYNAFHYYVPESEQEKEIPFLIKYEKGKELTQNCRMIPVRQWTIYLVQHTHTDIGYTRPQSEILPEHLRFIDYALDYCDLTDEYPDDAKFRWTCESSWPVEQYLIRRPEVQIDRLLKRIEEGRIEVTAMKFNMSEVADELTLKNMLEPIKLFQEKGIKVSTAMQDDVNGIGWCLADYMPDAGIQYLIMGEHGHRALIPFDLPTSFWWMSPSGKKILAFRGEHYMHANALLIHTGDLENFRSNLLNYLNSLREQEYPFDHLSLQYSGFVTDNSPPSIIPNQVIKEWNEKYVWPKLRSATASEFMQYTEKNYGHELKTHQKAWPDWWTDGFGSAARETAAIREAQSEMNVTTGLLTMSYLMGSEIKNRIHQEISQIFQNILFYDEHTFGAAESISEPYSENSVKQWAEKSSYAWESLKQSRILREEALGLLEQHVPKHHDPTVTIFNSMNQNRSGPVRIYADHDIIDPGSPFTLVDPLGKPVPVQAVSSRSDGTYWAIWADNVPAMGYKTYRIIYKEPETNGIQRKPFTGTFENDDWSIKIHPENGSLISLVNKRLQKELVDLESEWRPGQIIYERLSERHQLELFTLHEIPDRTSLTEVSFNYIEEGPVWTTISIDGALEGCAQGRIQVDYRIYNYDPVIELRYSMIKNPVLDPEALYVAFPFNMEKGQIFFEAQGGMMKPGIDQLPGTASDWNTVQNFVTIRSEESQIIITSPEIPLYHLGGMNLGKFSYNHRPETNHVFSWVLNNYWTTNFKASQEGALSWKYFITCSDDASLKEATQFGWQSRIPMVGRVFPSTGGPEKPDQKGLLLSHTSDLLLVSSTPTEEGDGIILQIREITGNRIELDPKSYLATVDIPQCIEVNAIGQPLHAVADKFIFEPYSVHFLKFTWHR